MPYEPKRKPDDMPRTLTVLPLEGKPRRGPGRPAVRKAPPMPQFEWKSEYERELYEYFIESIEADYPNIKPSDRLLLPLAAAEYVKWMRLVGSEVASGELVTMARQHPGTMFARLLDTVLGTTRKQRVAKGEDKKDDEFDLFNALSA